MGVRLKLPLPKNIKNCFQFRYGRKFVMSAKMANEGSCILEEMLEMANVLISKQDIAQNETHLPKSTAIHL